MTMMLNYHSMMITLIIYVCTCGAQEMLADTRCNHYSERGTCEDRGFTQKWYYDRFAHRCREFYYTGCGGNENRFDTFEECAQTCKFEQTVDDDPGRRCAQTHDPGPCAGNFERWHFDPRIRLCVCSWWSGCGGNSNLFYSYDHCMSVCGAFADNTTLARRSLWQHQESAKQHHAESSSRPPDASRTYRNLFATAQDPVRSPPMHSGTQHQIGRHSSGTAVVKSGYRTPIAIARKRGRLVIQTADGQWMSRTEWYRRYNRKLEMRRRLSEKRLPSTTAQRTRDRLASYMTQHSPNDDQRTFYGVISVNNGSTRGAYTQQRDTNGESPHEQQRQPQIHKPTGYMYQGDISRSHERNGDHTRGPSGGSETSSSYAQQPWLANYAHGHSSPHYTYEREMAAAYERERASARDRITQYAQMEQQYAEDRARALREREAQARHQRELERQRMIRYQNELRRYQQALQALEKPDAQASAVQASIGSLTSPSTDYGYQQHQQQKLVSFEHRREQQINRAKLRLRKRLLFEKLKKLEIQRLRSLLNSTTPETISVLPTPPLQVDNADVNRQHTPQDLDLQESQRSQLEHQQQLQKLSEIEQERQRSLQLWEQHVNRQRQQEQQGQQLEQYDRQQQLQLQYEPQPHDTQQEQQESQRPKPPVQHQHQIQPEYHQQQQQQQQKLDEQPQYHPQQQHILDERHRQQQHQQDERQAQLQSQQEQQHQNNLHPLAANQTAQQHDIHEQAHQQQHEQQQPQLQSQYQDPYQEQQLQQQRDEKNHSELQHHPQQQDVQLSASHIKAHALPELPATPVLDMHQEYTSSSPPTGTETEQKSDQQHDEKVGSGDTDKQAAFPIAVLPADHMTEDATGIKHAQAITPQSLKTSDDWNAGQRLITVDDYSDEMRQFADEDGDRWESSIGEALNTLHPDTTINQFMAVNTSDEPQLPNYSYRDDTDYGNIDGDQPITVEAAHRSDENLKEPVEQGNVADESEPDYEDSEEVFFWRPKSSDLQKEMSHK